MGDFNLILQVADKSNTRLNRRQMGSFRRVLDDLNLKEIHLNGRAFTWTNARERPTLERINRVFVSASWEALYPDYFLRALPSTASDHCPLLLSTSFTFAPYKRFHFETFWLKLAGFQDAAKAAWHCDTAIRDPFRRSNALFKATSKTLQSWSQRQCGNVHHKSEWQMNSPGSLIWQKKNGCFLPRTLVPVGTQEKASWPLFSRAHYSSATVAHSLAVGRER